MLKTDNANFKIFQEKTIIAMIFLKEVWAAILFPCFIGSIHSPSFSSFGSSLVKVGYLVVWTIFRLLRFLCFLFFVFISRHVTFLFWGEQRPWAFYSLGSDVNTTICCPEFVKLNKVN